jgi:hypothetical protein
VEREHLEKASQSAKQADTAWLKASGYDFKVKDNQQAGIELLSSFNKLPAPVLDANLKTVETINLDATRGCAIRRWRMQKVSATCTSSPTRSVRVWVKRFLTPMTRESWAKRLR